MYDEVVTREDLYGYATLDYVEAITRNVDERAARTEGDLTYRIREIENRCRGETGYISSELIEIRSEIDNIKEALIDIQDSLRFLGMDDMSKRIGDLNLLLT